MPYHSLLPTALVEFSRRRFRLLGRSRSRPGNWEADETWTAPPLFNVSNVALLGKRPVSFAVAAGPTVASPDAGVSWQFWLAATFLFPR